VAAVVLFGQRSESDVLMLARLASLDGGLGLVDAAVGNAAAGHLFTAIPTRDQFVPFDPQTKMAAASVIDHTGAERRVVKGAFAHIRAIAQASPDESAKAAELESEGIRVLGVAWGAPDALQLKGILALSDPPRSEAAGCVAKLNSMWKFGS